jgi:hypothetical protein
VIQGSVVVLKNGDGGILAEVGGRRVYRGRSTTFSDFNRVRHSLRQPGSAMKPIVYLAAFRQGDFTLETLVPDEPISVPTAKARVPKWISNYDGRFKGLIPIREALAESRNAVAIWITAQIGIDAVLRTLPQSRRSHAATALCDDGVRGLRSQLTGARDGLPDDRIRCSRAAVRDSQDRPRVWRRRGRTRTPRPTHLHGRRGALAHSGGPAGCRYVSRQARRMPWAPADFR